MLLHLIILLLWGDKGEEFNVENISDIENQESPIFLLWQIPLAEDTTFKFSIMPVLYKNGILYSAQRPSSTDPMYIKFSDTTQGNIIWQTDAVFEMNCTNPAAAFGNGSYLFNDLYVTLCNSDPRVININDGTIFWHFECTGGRLPFISHYQNILFHTHLTGFNPFSSASIVKTDIYSGIWDTVFTVNMTDDYSVDLYPPTVFVNEVPDTILYFQNRQYRTIPYDGKVDLYAYNMSADTIVWYVEDIDEHGNSAIFPPLFYDNKIYFKGAYTIYCLNALTGKMIWKKLFTGYGEDLIYGNLLVIDHKLIIKTSYESIYALDPNNGNIIWENKDAGATPSDMRYHNAVLYYGSAGDGNLHAIDVNSGQQLWEIGSPNSDHAASYGAIFSNAVVIDPILNRLYTTDGYYLLCFQLKN